MSKRKKHMKSILHQKDGTCFLCMLEGNGRKYAAVHEHHIYPGYNRQISEANGFKVYLCPEHHVFGPAAVHNNSSNMRLLQKECQRVYEKTHSREEFMKLIGRNYLDADEENAKENKQISIEDGFSFLEGTE